MKRLILFLVCLALISFLPKFTWAKVQGQCADCHTMHNSQNGASVVANGPYRALTIGDCVGCHTGTNTGSNNIPYVLSETTPNYGNFGIEGNTLAGGNFYWVKNGSDATGHNVVGIAGEDGAIGMTPPGWDTSFNANGALANNEATWSKQLTCAGTYGCHGKHDQEDDFAAIRGAHHADDSTIDGTTVGTSFRFLYGIKGIEDSDWEYQPTNTAHNQYYAVNRSAFNTPTDSATINYLCAECHGQFHSGNEISYTGSGSPWLRHPTDFALSSAAGAGYTAYPGPFGNAGDYWPGAPLGSDLTGGVLSTVQFSGNDDIVLCISCHRAHGSPYADLLRWDYNNCNASSGVGNQCGCFACHTNKY
ncbi:cytochrome c3 family protein [Thermodesulfatator autotrophicus]|uniref:cytochrome c3 family protein n=1 Tax=Thermodesulfatator autotrophicus TaxID=1795632 RepID=UPI000AD56B46|nr:cytochrome c3 family protein [Thermodesulfatator autotrophicus]